MQFADLVAKRVFRAYAFPCLEVHVSRGEISEMDARGLIRGNVRGRRLDEDLETKYFPRAAGRCAETARAMGKDVIDSEAVRRYFRFLHNGHVDEEAAANHIKNPAYCKTWPGGVSGIKNERHAYVRVASQGASVYRTELVDDLKIGDLVVVHRAFISEVISKETAVEMMKARNIPLPEQVPG